MEKEKKELDKQINESRKRYNKTIKNNYPGPGSYNLRSDNDYKDAKIIVKEKERIILEKQLKTINVPEDTFINAEAIISSICRTRIIRETFSHRINI